MYVIICFWFFRSSLLQNIELHRDKTASCNQTSFPSLFLVTAKGLKSPLMCLDKGITSTFSISIQ